MLNRVAVEGTDRYVVTCLYGLEGLLADEVQERLHVPGERHWSEVAFHYGGDPRHVGALRLAGNVFLCIDRVRIGPSLADLAPLTDRLRALPLARWERLAGAFHDEAAGEIGIRVDRKGKHRFTYAQVEELALEAVATATGRRTTLEDRPLQLKVDVHNEWCRLLARLTVRSLAVRDYRRCHARSATDPTLAAAMGRMTEPRGDDVFLDPFCGTGSVAIERCLAGAAQRVVAGERNERRIGWARTNAQAAGADVQFACWDAAALPYETGTWTPEIAGGTTAGVISYTAQNGFYCKTGRLVFVNSHIVINTISAAPTGTLFVRALPFTMTSSTGYRGLAAVYTNLASWGLGRTQINGYFNPSDGPARLALMGSQNAGSYYYLTGTDIHAGDRIVVTGFYITD